MGAAVQGAAEQGAAGCGKARQGIFMNEEMRKNAEAEAERRYPDKITYVDFPFSGEMTPQKDTGRSSAFLSGAEWRDQLAAAERKKEPLGCPCGKCHCVICGNQMNKHPLQAEIERLRGALAFYADNVYYNGPNQSPISGKLTRKGGYLLDVTWDRGAIARQALGTSAPKRDYKAAAEHIKQWIAEDETSAPEAQNTEEK